MINITHTHTHTHTHHTPAGERGGRLVWKEGGKASKTNLIMDAQLILLCWGYRYTLSLSHTHTDTHTLSLSIKHTDTRSLLQTQTHIHKHYKKHHSSASQDEQLPAVPWVHSARSPWGNDWFGAERQETTSGRITSPCHGRRWAKQKGAPGGRDENETRTRSRLSAEGQRCLLHSDW